MSTTAKNKTFRERDGILDNKGPQNYADRDTPERILYCGSSLRRFQYYAPSVFLAYLKAFAGRTVTVHDATERQFMNALAPTAARMRNRHVVRGTASYMGPQCISHRVDPARTNFVPIQPTTDGRHRGTGNERCLDLVQCSTCAKWRRVDLSTISQYTNEAWCLDELHDQTEDFYKKCPVITYERLQS